jgi:hypothetical protein
MNGLRRASSPTPRPGVVAGQAAERIVRALDMLQRLGARSPYEPNYAIEKLADAALRCIEACVLLGMSERDVDRLVDKALTRVWPHAADLRDDAGSGA